MKRSNRQGRQGRQERQNTIARFARIRICDFSARIARGYWIFLGALGVLGGSTY
jgi:hypothetical protein